MVVGALELLCWPYVISGISPILNLPEMFYFILGDTNRR